MHIYHVTHRTPIDLNRESGKIDLSRYGADERSRTADLLITNQLLYQLSYVGPEDGFGFSLPRRPSLANDVA